MAEQTLIKDVKRARSELNETNEITFVFLFAPFRFLTLSLTVFPFFLIIFFVSYVRRGALASFRRPNDSTRADDDHAAHCINFDRMFANVDYACPRRGRLADTTGARPPPLSDPSSILSSTLPGCG